MNSPPCQVESEAPVGRRHLGGDTRRFRYASLKVFRPESNVVVLSPPDRIQIPNP